MKPSSFISPYESVAFHWPALIEQVRLGALRWLHGLDLDKESITYGVADREFWAWKTKDFANGTWQGGLAGFLDASPWLALNDAALMQIVSAVIHGTHQIQRLDGSFEEAYPLESSYCVTALVLFDLLYTERRFPQYFDEATHQSLRKLVSKGLRFMEATPETHGVIANHLATGVMAMAASRQYLGTEPKEAELLTFLALQHPQEDWFPEYGGADPGYQTLLNHYLCRGGIILKAMPPELIGSLERSLGFVEAFAFPDGSYAEEVGSRGTGIVYPAGTLRLGSTDAQPTTMTDWWLTRYSVRSEAVTPTNVDAGNFVPIFNSWAQLARNLADTNTELLPSLSYPTSRNKNFPFAGLWIFQQPEAMMVVSRPSAVLRRVILTDGIWQDDSLVSLTKKEGAQCWTTQGVIPSDWHLDNKTLAFEYCAIPRNQTLNTWWKAIVLRGLAGTTALFPVLQRGMKKLLARLVMGRSSKACKTGIKATVDLQDALLPIQLEGQTGQWRAHRAGFHQHMASANTFRGRQLL